MMFFIIVAVASLVTSSADEKVTAVPAPVFLSSGENVTAIAGRAVELPCKVINLLEQHQQVMWYNKTIQSYNGISIGRDHVLLPAERGVSVRGVESSEYNLHIRHVTVWEEGRYLCYVSGRPPSTQTTYLTVNVPPVIMSFSPNESSTVTVLEGDDVTLKCIADGKPLPVVTWRRRSLVDWMPSEPRPPLGGRNMKDVASNGVKLHEGEEFHIGQVGRNDLGQYDCEASNEVFGSPVVRSFQLQVEYVPEVVTSESLAVMNAAGLSISISCTFNAYPPVDSVWWLHNDVLLDMTQPNNSIRHSREKNDMVDKDVLVITDVLPKNCGQYVCVGRNTVGEARAKITISPIPFNLSVTSSWVGQYHNQYTAVWTVNSYWEPVEFYMTLKQTKYNDSSDDLSNNTFECWNSTAFVQTANQNLPFIRQSFTFSCLLPDTNYTLLLNATNKFGSTNTSTFYFRTAALGRLFNVGPTVEDKLSNAGMDAPANVLYEATRSGSAVVKCARSSLLTALLIVVQRFLIEQTLLVDGGHRQFTV